MSFTVICRKKMEVLVEKKKNFYQNIPSWI